ncbi:MAG: 5'-nucleotidase C-terminal domain-containing protein [Acidimicrobiia bacterium]
MTIRNPRRLVIIAFAVAMMFAVLVPVAATAAGGTFTDDDSSVFEADIEWLAAEGITKGCNPPVNDKFCPDDGVTRGQMAAFLARALNLTDGANANLFNDDDGSIFEPEINMVGTAGITMGCNPPANDNYCPDDLVTREQMAAYLTRALGLEAGVGADLFTDDDGSIFEADIDRLGTAGVTKGCNPPANDRYCPKDTVTRGQMAAFLHRGLTIPEEPAGIELQILAFNDYHGHVQSGDAGTVAGEVAGGGEYLSAKLNELRSGNSLTVAAGDLIGGSPAFSGLFHDEPSVESLNAMGLDVSSVGNHEFDEGVTELLRMQDGGCHPVDGCYFPEEPYPGADFNWLAANVVDKYTGDTALPPYWIDEVEGEKVAFIGMTLEATDTLVAAAGIKGWAFLDEAETANKLVPILKDMGVEAIIVLLHEGGSQTPPPGDVDACVGISGPIVAINAALDPEIDALITGHTHLPYNCSMDDSAGEPRIVTSAYSYGRVVSELNLIIDPATHDVDRYLSTSTNHSVIQDELTPDPVITSIIEKWQPLYDAAGTIPIGMISADITRGGDPTGSDRGVESAAGNLVADAQQWATTANGAVVAFMNPGGVRSDLTYLDSAGEGDGVVTYGEAFTFQPFGNTLVTLEMTGAEIVSVLEEQCQPAGSSRPFLSLGVSDGFSYDLAWTLGPVDDDGDPSTPDVDSCTSITVSNVMLNGSALSDTATYMVTANSFLADGGDNFTTFAGITGPRLDGGVDLQALSNYLAAFGPVDPPSTDRVNELP